MRKSLAARRAIPVAGMALIVAITAGCSTSAAEQNSGTAAAAVVSVPSQNTPFKGTALGRPFAKPTQTLTDTRGKPFNIAKDTAGKIVVLYIGYTNCPDVCPTTMADTAVALRALPPAERSQVKVVFVTSDPARDTSKRLASWLGFFRSDFVGLTGTQQQVSAVAQSVGIPISPPVKNPDGSITVEHGAEILLFGKDETARELFTSGFTADELTNDLSFLIKGETPHV